MKELIEKLRSIFYTRVFFLILVFGLMFSILIIKILSVQVEAKNPEKIAEQARIFKIRDIKTPRGNIYDVNGKLLAYNTMSYSAVMEDSGLLTTNAEKNAMIYKLIKILEKHNVELEVTFGIELGESGELEFNVADNALLRFKKNAYGLKSVNDLSEAQINATAADVYDFLAHDRIMFGISDEYEIHDALKICAIRYTIFANVVGTQFTIASNISEELAVSLMENRAELPGIEVKQVTSRVYNEALYFAHIVGYTGAINTDEIETLNSQIIKDNNLTDDDLTSVKGVSLLYNATDVVGKTGIEKSMESVLSGTKGTSVLTVNSAGKILSQTNNTNSVAGNDIYLSIDTDLQKACYHILERNLAGILLSKLTPNLDYGGKGTSASKIKIPVFEVYYALIDNGIIDIEHFKAEDATTTEKKVADIYDANSYRIISNLRSILDFSSEAVNSSTSEEMQEYLNFVFDKALSSGLLIESSDMSADSNYKNYKNNKMSMSEFFRYAFTKDWINTSLFSNKNEYYSLSELYNLFLTKLLTAVQNDNNFKEKVYRSLIFNQNISGRDICLLLYDQNVIKYNRTNYNKLSNGSVSAYKFIYECIYNLEITPGQLGLTPCSGSIVITDVNTGTVKALVTYPSYDNNMLANKIDYNYYSSLLELNSTPLINRPAMQTTTTGSTFKMLTALMGMGEGVINPYTKIYDKGIFESVVPSPRCWIYPGTHKSLTVTDAIMHSCNYFFFDVGYRLMNNKNGTYSDQTGIKMIQKYAGYFGLNTKTGIEISEATPQVSNNDAVRSSIGYGHAFSPVQISRYITALASKGKVYNYTLLDSVRTSDNTIVSKQETSLYNDLTTLYSNEQWNAVRYGMWKVVNTSVDGFDTLYSSLSVQVAGKTGTAQVSTTSPSHVLFGSFAPYNNPEISVMVVIPNGFQSANAAYLAKEVYAYYFDGVDKEALLSGNVKASAATNLNVVD